MPKATNKGGDFAPIPSGIHHAVCYSIIDLGTQPSQMFAPSRKVLIIWELPFERADFKNEKTGAIENKPRVISKEYTLSTGAKSNLRKDLESWRGKPFTTEEANCFEVGVLAEKNCQVNVAHKPSKDGTKTYANVISIVPLGKGQKPVKPENKVLVWDLPESGVITFPDNMPEWVQNKIKNSEEYVESVTPRQHRNEPSEEEMANLTVGQSTAGEEDVPF